MQVYNEEFRSNELYHYGIKGMKWGVRRNRTGKSKKSRKRLPVSDSEKKILLEAGNYAYKSAASYAVANILDSASQVGVRGIPNSLLKVGKISANVYSLYSLMSAIGDVEAYGITRYVKHKPNSRTTKKIEKLLNVL